MAAALTSALAPSRTQPFLLLQSSTAQSSLSILGAIANQSAESAQGTTCLLAFLYPPNSLLAHPHTQSERVRVLDRTAIVPGYDDTLDPGDDLVSRLRRDVLDVVNSTSPGPLTVIIDSVDTILSDTGSISETIRLLTDVLSLVCARGGTSRLIVHAIAPSPLLAHLSSTRFSPALTHLTAHPPALLVHIAEAYLTPPPPLSPPNKFYAVFLPAAARTHESDALVFGPAGEGSGSSGFVVEVLVRGGARRGVERALDGWADGPCPLSAIAALRHLWARRSGAEQRQGGPDPTQNLSFNLNLTPEQQRSRSQVPLPYAHEGKDPGQKSTPPAAILYDPDSADDLDDDDPDEDLDI